MNFWKKIDEGSIKLTSDRFGNIYASADVITAATPVSTHVTYRSANAVVTPKTTIIHWHSEFI